MRGLAVIAPVWRRCEDDEDEDNADAADLHPWTRVAMGFIYYDGQQEGAPATRLRCRPDTD